MERDRNVPAILRAVLALARPSGQRRRTAMRPLGKITRDVVEVQSFESAEQNLPALLQSCGRVQLPRGSGPAGETLPGLTSQLQHSGTVLNVC